MAKTARHAADRAPDADAIAAGHAVYTPGALRFYDLAVHGLSNRLAWGCPTSVLEAHYRAHLTDNHLEAGVGTGFFLDRAGRAVFRHLTLLDINANCLARSASRLARYHPDLMQASLFEPLPVERRYESVGLTYVLHCLPGPMPAKLCVLDHLASTMEDGGVLFGATILGRGIPFSPFGRALLGLYNRRRIFDNLGDDLGGLKAGLLARFGSVAVSLHGAVALFAARKGGAESPRVSTKAAQ